MKKTILKLNQTNNIPASIWIPHSSLSYRQQLKYTTTFGWQGNQNNGCVNNRLNSKRSNICLTILFTKTKTKFTHKITKAT